jgi:cbb3-type cytochrome oxidase subunit 3
MVEKAATSVFLIITVAAFIDVIAGFFIALRPTRRSSAASARAPQEASSWPSDTATQGSQLGQGSHG